MDRRKAFKRLCQKVGQTVYRQSLLEPNDKILVGMSGGKDSFLLLELLEERKKHLPFPVEIAALHVSIKEIGYSVDIELLKDFCNQRKIAFYYVEDSIGSDLDRAGKAPCFVCSWHRRKNIFQFAQSMGYNKVALGHHRDDALQTFLLNLIYHGSISSLPYKLSMFDGQIKLIRPLLDITEKEILTYTRLAGYPAEIKACTFKHDNKREQMKMLLQIIRKLHPLAERNIFRSMRNIYEEYLP
ncbi:MAG: tRNA lysidine(34) synthetase [Bacteroidales bacterium]